LPVETPSQRRVAFADAYEAYLRGDDGRAQPLFEALAQTSPELADYHLYFLASIYARTGRDDEAAKLYGEILRTYPQSVHAPAAALGDAVLLQRAGRDDEARPLLERALDAPDSGTRLRARLALAEADERLGAVVDAQAGFMRVRREGKGSKAAQLAKERLAALRARLPYLEPTGPALLVEGRLLLAEGEAPAAERTAARLLADPAGVDRGQVERLRADAIYAQGRLDEAFSALWDIAEDYPASTAAPAALQRMGTLLWNRDRDEAARRAFQEFLDRYPGRAGASDCLYAIARIDQTAGRDTEALHTFQELLRRYPRSKVANDARWRIGWIRYQNHDWLAAAHELADLARHAQGVEEQGAEYWRARALEHAGRRQQAERLYRGLMARDPSGY
jgi:TolA-binding protein